MQIILNVFEETWFLLLEMSPYLLFGFFIAGFLHTILDKSFIYRHLSGKSIFSIIKATLLGIPLPVCSCGVIPIAAHLKKRGAGRGSVLAFLISTPTSGVDSILATYALMGPIFAILRPISSFFGGFLAGILSNNIDKTPEIKERDCDVCETNIRKNKQSFFNKLIGIIRYGFVDLIEDTGKWLIIGIIAGGLISALLPQNIIEIYLSNTFFSYILMLIIAIPLYVCATGSIPIAASLMLKGLSPGAALIFLIAGPATNTATISFIYGKFGKKTFIIYLFSIIVTGILFGLLFDYIWNITGLSNSFFEGGMKMLPLWLKQVSAILLILFISRMYAIKIISKVKKNQIKGKYKEFIISNMTCMHCEKIITKALKQIDSIEEVVVDLKTKKVRVFIFLKAISLLVEVSIE